MNGYKSSEINFIYTLVCFCGYTTDVVLVRRFVVEPVKVTFNMADSMPKPPYAAKKLKVQSCELKKH